jgi:hypothetical protein
LALINCAAIFLTSFFHKSLTFPVGFYHDISFQNSS